MSAVHVFTTEASTIDGRNTNDRLEFFRSVGETFGVNSARIELIDVGLDPLSIIEFLLPESTAEARSEIMWALGEFERRLALPGPAARTRTHGSHRMHLAGPNTHSAERQTRS